MDSIIHDALSFKDNEGSMINTELDKNVVFFDISANSNSYKSLIKLMSDRFAKISLFLTENHELYEENEKSTHLAQSQLNTSLRKINITHENNGFFNPSEINIVLRINPANKKTHIKTESNLTLREQEIMALLSKGLLYKEIAKSMGISIQTVKSHLKHIYPKLNASNRTEAILKFLE